MANILLVVDDDPHIRQLVRRVAIKDFDVKVLEASNGVAALDILLTEPVDLMLLDVSMPVMDGFETLEAVRRSAQLAGLPVIILAGKAEERQVLRLVELGIAGFFVKPFRPAMLRERLANVLAPVSGRPTLEVRRTLQPLELHGSSRVLVVDRAPEFCSFFGEQLGTLCAVEVAHALPRALAMCVEQPPDAVFVGVVDHVLETELFVRKLRLAAEHRALSVVAIVDPTDDGAAAARGLYDGIVHRSYVPAIFRRSVRSALTDASTARWLLAPKAERLAQFSARARTLLQTKSPFDIVAGDATPEWATTRGRWIAAALEVHVHALSWDLMLQLPYSAALVVGALQVGLETDTLSGEAVLGAVAAVLKELGAELQAEMKEDALELTLGEPRASVASAYTARDGRPRIGDDAHWWFSLRGRDDGIALSLMALGARRPKRDSPITTETPGARAGSVPG